MNDLDLNRLKTFIVVVETSSVSEAAKKMFRTQPAISTQISQLEQELKIKLFEKQGRKLVLTRDGEKLYIGASEKIAMLEDEIFQITNGQALKTGTLRIASVPDLGHRLIVPALKKFKDKFPDIQLQISFGPSEMVQEYLLNRRYDIGFVTETGASSQFKIDTIAEITTSLVSSASYLKKFKSHSFTINDIIKMDWIDCAHNWRMVSFWFKKNSPKHHNDLLKKHPEIVIDTYQGMLKSVKEGLGLSVLPSFLIDKDLKNASLIEPLPRIKRASFSLYSIQNINHFRTHTESDFIRMLDIHSF